MLRIMVGSNPIIQVSSKFFCRIFLHILMIDTSEHTLLCVVCVTAFVLSMGTLLQIKKKLQVALVERPR